MNSAPKISNSLAQQLNLMASALLPALPPFDKTAPDVAALLKRLTKSEDDQDIAQSAAVWRGSAAHGGLAEEARARCEGRFWREQERKLSAHWQSRRRSCADVARRILRAHAACF